jgi:hypothetical protein
MSIICKLLLYSRNQPDTVKISNQPLLSPWILSGNVMIKRRTERVRAGKRKLEVIEPRNTGSGGSRFRLKGSRQYQTICQARIVDFSVVRERGEHSKYSSGTGEILYFPRESGTRGEFLQRRI